MTSPFYKDVQRSLAARDCRCVPGSNVRLASECPWNHYIKTFQDKPVGNRATPDPTVFVMVMCLHSRMVTGVVIRTLGSMLPARHEVLSCVMYHSFRIQRDAIEVPLAVPLQFTRVITPITAVKRLARLHGRIGHCLVSNTSSKARGTVDRALVQT